MLKEFEELFEYEGKYIRPNNNIHYDIHYDGMTPWEVIIDINTGLQYIIGAGKDIYPTNKIYSDETVMTELNPYQHNGKGLTYSFDYIRHNFIEKSDYQKLKNDFEEGTSKVAKQKNTLEQAKNIVLHNIIRKLFGN
ncbi:MAG: hypothetical protein MR691_04505 [Clostridium sp.]|nr:hypothetical protein [Clostridium sp.]